MDYDTSVEIEREGRLSSGGEVVEMEEGANR